MAIPSRQRKGVARCRAVRHADGRCGDDDGARVRRSAQVAEHDRAIDDACADAA